MNSDNKGLLSMPPNSQPANPTHGGTAASQPLYQTLKKTKINMTHENFLNLVKKLKWAEAITLALVEDVFYMSNTYAVDENDNIVGLNLSGNEKVNSVFDLEGVSTLKYLNLAGCNIYNIEGLSNCEHLTHLSLSGCGYESQESLDYDDDRLDAIQRFYGFEPFDTRCLSTLKKLKHINLNDTQFYKGQVTVQEPVWFGDLSDILQAEDLEELYLSGFFVHDTTNINLRQESTDLDQLERLRKLTKLDLSNNYSIENEDLAFLKKLSLLISLNLSGNGITEFSLIFLEGFPKLEFLNLYKNPIKNIPEEIFNRDENVFEGVKTYLRSLIKIDESTIIHYAGHGGIPRNLTPPPFLTEFFIGRERELQQIYDLFLLEGQSQIILANGVGGVGKTTLAARYFHFYQNYYAHLACLYCGQGISNALLTLANSLGIAFSDYESTEERISKTINSLSNLEKPCLLILDNANDLEDLEKTHIALRKLNNFHILVTSRISDYNYSKTIEISPITKQEGEVLFSTYYPNLDDNDKKIFHRIYDAVGGNTLIIELLAKNLQSLNKFNTKYSLLELLNDLQSKGLFSIDESNLISSTYQYQDVGLKRENIGQVVEAMYDLTSLTKDELRILSFFAVLPPEIIPYTALTELIPDIENQKDILSNLETKGWLQLKKEISGFICHPIVQETVRYKIADIKEYVNPLILSLTDKIDYEQYGGHLINTSYEEASVYARYAQTVISNLNKQDKDIAVLCNRIGNFYEVTGNLTLSLQFYENSARILDELLSTEGVNEIETKELLKTSYSKLGDVNNSLGNLDRAFAFYEKYSQLSEELYEAYPQNVSFKSGLAISYSKLGDVNNSLGYSDRAFAFYEKYSRLSEEMYEAYPQNVSFKNGLAISYSKLGDVNTALGNLDRAFAFYEEYSRLSKELYEAYPQNVSFKKGLAIAYSKLGDVNTTLRSLDRAFIFYEKYSRLSEELYEAYPQNVSFKSGLAIAYSNIGAIASALGEFEKGLSFYEKVNAISKELYESFPQNVSFRNNLAYSYLNLGTTNERVGNLDLAKALYSESLRIFKDIQKDFPDYSYNLQTIAQLHETIANLNIQKGEKEEALLNIGSSKSINIKGNNNIVIQNISESNITISKNIVTGSIITAGGDIHFGDSTIAELNTEYLHQAKMIFVGNGNVGKSSIVFRLFDKSSPLPPRKETQGFEVNRNLKPYVIEDIPISVSGLDKKINYTFSIWDFGGQGKYREVQNLFFSRKSLYVYVTAVDDKEGGEYIGYDYWLQMVKFFGSDKNEGIESPIIHVVNKIDLPEYSSGIGFDISISKKDRKGKYNITNFFEVSCEDKSNFDKFEASLLDVLPNIGKNKEDVFSVRFRRNWFKVKEELEVEQNKGVNYIPYSQYLSICIKNGLDENEAREWVLYLDRIGIVIYFRNNNLLKEWVFLNTVWIKDAFCRVIDSEEIKSDNQGRLTKGYRKLIWKDYDEKDYDKFIELMLENRFCYRQNDYYVIPSCLPEEVPVFPNFLNNFEFTLNIKYANFLPAGVVNKLLVLFSDDVYSFGVKYLIWKNGFVIQHPESGSFAMIEEKWSEKIIEINIQSKDAYEIYYKIKKGIEILNSEFENEFLVSKLEIDILASYKGTFQTLDNLKEMPDAKNKYYFLFGKTNNINMNHKDYIEKLIATGEIDTAIQQFLKGTKANGQADLYSDSLLLSARFHSNENDKLSGTIVPQDYKIERTKIIDSLAKHLNSYHPSIEFNEEYIKNNVDLLQESNDIQVPETFITEMKRQFEDEYKKMQRFENLLSNMKDKELRTNFEEEIELCDENISRIEKRYLKKIKANKPQLSEISIKQMINDLKTSISERFDKIDENLQKLHLIVIEVVASINENEIEENEEDKIKAEQLLHAILERIDKIEPAKKREVGSDLNADITTGAKLKLVIPLIPTILTYETEFALSAKEPIKSWKDVWSVFFKKKTK